MSSIGSPIDGTQSILWQCRAGADIASRGIKHHTTKPSYSIINTMTSSDDS